MKKLLILGAGTAGTMVANIPANKIATSLIGAKENSLARRASLRANRNAEAAAAIIMISRTGVAAKTAVRMIKRNTKLCPPIR